LNGHISCAKILSNVFPGYHPNVFISIEVNQMVKRSFLAFLYIVSFSACAFSLSFSADQYQVTKIKNTPEMSMVRSMTGGQTTKQGKYYYDNGRSRYEDDKSIMIGRADELKIWTFDKGEKTYSEIVMTDQDVVRSQKGVKELNVKSVQVGEEKINGVLCRKMKTTSKLSEKPSYSWVAKEDKRVSMKTLLDTPYSYGSIEMKNVKFGRQPQSLFQIPKGYTKAKN
jgi:hypothetical protein